jgi:hypothetical protein
MNDPANSSDEELAQSLSDSDDQAVTTLVERYAPSLYDFALRLTLDTEAAVEITRAAFDYLRGHASERPAELQVRPWLFNYVMEQGLEVTADRSRPTGGRLSTGDRRFTLAGAEIDAEAALWAWQAARSLRPRDYAVLDMTARRELSPEDLTGSATQGRGGVYTILSRASSAFAEAYVATALYFRGRDACSDLSELVGGSGAAMRVGIRRQIASHVEDCETCQSTLESLPNASDVFKALYEVEMPPELPEQLIAGGAGAAAVAAGQLSLDDAAPEGEEAPAGEEGPSEEEQSSEAEAPAEEEEQVPAEGQGPEAGEGTQEPVWAPPAEGGSEQEAEAPSVSEEELWARPEAGAGFAGVASADIPEAVSELEEGLGFEPPQRPGEPTEVYTQYGSEYAAEPYYGYEPAPLTLSERLSIWFEPAYGRSFVWSYALLGVATAVAVYLGIAVATSLGGDDGGSAAVIGDDEVREIACDTGPMSVDAGDSRMFEFDPDALDGFELDTVLIAERPDVAQNNALTVEVAGATSLTATAKSVLSTTERSDEYGLQITWQRNGEDAVTDCPILLNVPASTAPASTPEDEETPEADGTPEAEETP